MVAEQLITDFLLIDEEDVPTTPEQAWRRIIRHLLRVRSLSVSGDFLAASCARSSQLPLRDVYP